MVPQKHKDMVQSHYNSGFFITTNIYPDFGTGRDAEAIRKRLCIFNTVALPTKDPMISSMLILLFILMVLTMKPQILNEKQKLLGLRINKEKYITLTLLIAFVYGKIKAHVIMKYEVLNDI